MISASSYNVPSYSAVYPPVPARKNAAMEKEAAAAADFERILNAPAPARPAQANSAAPPKAEDHSFLSFIKDLIDIINPLQHIPVIGAIYRHITGDEMGPVAHIVGDTIYGGPIGGVVAMADIAYEKTTGRDFGETVIAGLTGSKTPDAKAPDTMLARNLNDGIAPAAGGEKTASNSNDIIWNDVSPKNSPLSPPPAHPTGTRGVGPAPSSTLPSPVYQAKGTASTTVLQAQEAPAGMARTAVPPELIASKMMEALDKYAEMKRPPAAPKLSAAY